MKHVDYLVVGCGLAGLHFTHLLEKKGKSLIVIDDDSQQSSKVASGLYNPIVLKRFTAVRNAQEQLDLALPIYKNLEQTLAVKFVDELPVLRRFASVEEQNNWFAKLDNPALAPFLSPNLVSASSEHVNAPYKMGRVLQTGRVNTSLLIDSYRKRLAQSSRFLNEKFNYDALKMTKNGIEYNNIYSKHVVFAEGFGSKMNPFFNKLPLVGSKGELLTVKIPLLNINYVFRGPVFLIPLEDDTYQVGSTYNRNDLTNTVTLEAKHELSEALKTMISCPFEILSQQTGIRPTVKDRNPLVGRHKDFSNVFILNGSGTRGVMITPYIANALYEHIENNAPILADIDCNRYDY